MGAISCDEDQRLMTVLSIAVHLHLQLCHRPAVSTLIRLLSLIYHTISYYIMLYHTISHYIILYNTISYSILVRNSGLHDPVKNAITLTRHHQGHLCLYDVWYR